MQDALRLPALRCRYGVASHLPDPHDAHAHTLDALAVMQTAAVQACAPHSTCCGDNVRPEAPLRAPADTVDCIIGQPQACRIVHPAAAHHMCVFVVVLPAALKAIAAAQGSSGVEGLKVIEKAKAAVSSIKVRG